MSPEGAASEASTRAEALRALLRGLAEGQAVTSDAVGAAFDAVVRGEATAGQIGALLMGLRVQGETAEVLSGVVRALRRAMLRVEADQPGDLVDTCGTGGGTLPTFNISTVAALVAAGAGVRIAKHGNRSYRSKSGSADVLEALGVPLDLSQRALASVLAEAGIVFMFAPQMHPAMRYVAPVRKELGVTTVMNLVGPLANPASVTRQVLGVGDAAHLPIMARTLATLGTTHALVVHGAPGLDEISPIGRTTIIEVRGDQERSWTLDPAEFHLAAGTAQEIRGGEPTDNAALAIELLSGGGPTAARAAVILNAAAAIYVAGRAATYGAAIALARGSLEERCGLAALERLRHATARHRGAERG